MKGRLDKPLQRDRVLAYLSQMEIRLHGATAMQIQNALGICDAKARIRDLRGLGYHIDTMHRDDSGHYSLEGTYFLRDTVAHG